MKIAIVISLFNEQISSGLLAGSKEFLAERDINISSDDIFYAPGAFELPLIARNLAQTGLYNGVICLGCVIKGETAHFEYISMSTSLGIQQAALETDTPVGFGVLTVYEREQAIARSSENAENKGREAAAAVYETARTLREISKLES